MTPRSSSATAKGVCRGPYTQRVPDGALAGCGPRDSHGTASLVRIYQPDSDRHGHARYAGRTQ
jgi:hypothetical protein